MGISPAGGRSPQKVRNTAAASIRSAGHSWTTRLWGRLSFLSTLINGLFERRLSPKPTSSLAGHRISSGPSTETPARTDSPHDGVSSRSSRSTERSLSFSSSTEDPRSISPTWSGSISTAESSLTRLKELESSKDYETILVEYAGISHLPDIQKTWKRAYERLSSQVDPGWPWEDDGPFSTIASKKKSVQTTGTNVMERFRRIAKLLVTFAPRYCGQNNARVLTKVSPFLRIAALTIRNKGNLSEAQASTLTAIVEALKERAPLKEVAALCQKAYQEVGADKCASIALCYKALTGEKLI